MSELLIAKALKYEKQIPEHIEREAKVTKSGDRNIFEVINQILAYLKGASVAKWMSFMDYVFEQFLPSSVYCPPECRWLLWQMLYHALVLQFDPIDLRISEIMAGCK